MGGHPNGKPEKKLGFGKKKEVGKRGRRGRVISDAHTETTASRVDSDRRASQETVTVTSIDDEDPGEEQDNEDDEVSTDEREI